jgi:hypothetical protein
MVGDRPAPAPQATGRGCLTAKILPVSYSRAELLALLLAAASTEPAQDEYAPVTTVQVTEIAAMGGWLPEDTYLAEPR